MKEYGACFALAGWLVVTAFGCRQPDVPTAPAKPLKVTLEINPSPPAVGEAEVLLTLTDSDGQPLTGGEIELEGNMDHAGMKPVFSELKETEPGKYAGTLEFTMGGDWFVLVTGQLADGQQLNEKVDLPGVKWP